MRPIESLRESSIDRGAVASHLETGSGASTLASMVMAADLGGVEPPTSLASQFPELPLLLTHHRPRREWEAMLKRVIDVIVAALLTLCAAPIMLAIAVIIKLTSSGSILFRQKRVGFQGNVFEILKFRTMYSHMADPLAERQSCKQDERVTRFGRLLRRTSLDELPQFFNVLAGDMSLVGPRPHALEMSVNGQPLECVTETYRYRYSIKPGITGWAQVNGCRGQLNTIEKVVRRVEHDLHYIQNWSLILDLKILTLSVACTLGDEAAF